MNGSGEPRRLVRRPTDGKLGGVCAGIAEYFGADVTVVRLLWVVFSIVPGGVVGGVVAYIAAWILMPEAFGSATINPSTRRLTRSVTDYKVAGVCGGMAEYLGIDSTAVRVAWVVLSIVPGVVLCGVFAYLVAWFIMPEGRVTLMTSTPATPNTSEPSAA